MAEGGHDEFVELLYYAEDDQELDYTDRTPPATMGNKYRLYDTAAVELINLTPENRPIVNAALNKNNADESRSANNIARPTVNAVLNKHNADEIRSANNDIDVRPKNIGKRKSHGHFESDPTEDPVRDPRIAPVTTVAPMGSPEAQRLNSLIASQKQIIERQNMLLKKLADRQWEQDAILDDSDSSPVARRLDLSDRTSRTALQPPDRAAGQPDSFRTSRTVLQPPDRAAEQL